MFIWRFIIHQLGLDYGGPGYGVYVPYDLWSGIAGSFVVGLIAFSIAAYWRSTCHYSWKCFRHGKHLAAGGTFRLCWKHHPDMGERPHRDQIHRLHHEWKAAQ